MPETIRLSGERGRFSKGPMLKPIPAGAPWNWLAAGWEDFVALKSVSMGFGALLAAISIALLAGLFMLQLGSAALAMAGGFLLVAPLAATGLYEAARRRAEGLPVHFRHIVLPRVKSPVQIRFLGVGLMALYLVWLEVALILFALFSGGRGLPPLEEFLPTLLFTRDGLALLVAGSIAGGALALAAYAATALSLPMLAARDMDAVSAIVCSIRAVNLYPRAMLLWAWLIALFTLFGIVTLGIGLIITYPLIGYATWHAYADVIEDDQ